MPGVTCVAPTAAFYAMPKVALPPGRTDEDYVMALLHATGVLCVYGSGFGLPADEGFLRIVFLAPLDELREIYDLMAAVHARVPATACMIDDRDFTRRMLQTVFTVAAVAILVARLWAAREALMLIYVSALIAMGFSPLVELLERPRRIGSGSAAASALARDSRHLRPSSWRSSPSA